MLKTLRFAGIFVLPLLLGTGEVRAVDVDAAESVATDGTFDEAIRPFVTKHCVRCHGAQVQEGDFRIDELSPDLRDDTHASQWEEVVTRLRAGEMPPEDEDVLPTTAESQEVVAWLTSRLATRVTPTDHWAFQPLTRPQGDSVDYFVERQLAEENLALSLPAAPERLLRRVYLDLIGLPPTPKASAAFANDPTAEKFAAIVDELLASPRYGERWGRHWLDLARYADSNGLHEDGDRPHAWRYRDYVISSFNADKAYGQFIREQLAGDEIDRNNPDAWIATGFCRGGPSNEENIAANEVESYRLDQLDDILATTTQVFLGQTIQCARCHNHKLEPFTLIDYYSLLAVFDNSVSAYVPLDEGRSGDPKLFPIRPRAKNRPPKEPHIRALSDKSSQPAVTHVLLRGNLERPGDEVAPAVPEVLNLFTANFSVHPGEQTSGRRAALANWIAAPENGLTWRVMANRVWQHHFGRGLVETPSNLGQSGAKPSHPALLDWLACELRDNGGHLKPLHRLIVLSKTYQQASTHRSDAAENDPDNRTLWRYPVHRLEAEVIRDSILAASGNLNVEQGGPGIKPRLPAELLGQSKRNAWPKIGRESSQHWRRSVYIYLKRQLPMPMLTLFDAPDASQSCAVRFTSTTPTQALVLLNDEFVNEQARYLARRVMAGDSKDPAQAMLELVWAMPATAEQVAEAKTFVAERLAERSSQPEAEKLALADLAVVLFNSSQFVYVD
ncbi:MAG: PSD1 and planctomycete cytochrome C domain-containing protein [Pirellulaceae bacterium]